MCNNKHYFSIHNYRRHVAEAATMYFRGSRSPVVNGRRYLPLWWTSGEVRIFTEQGITDPTVNTVIDMLKQRANELDLKPFHFKVFGPHPSALQQVRDSLVRGQIDPYKFFDICVSEDYRDQSKGGMQHADIVITKRSFLDDTVSWGAASWAHGAMIFTLHGDRQHHTAFLKKVALHEANHLFGMPLHCDHYQNVDGYRYDTRCNMHYCCPTEVLCPKCKDFITQWWLQIERECNITKA